MKKILIAVLIILLIFVLAVIVAEYNVNRETIAEPEEPTTVTVEPDKIVTETGAIAPGFELKDRNGDTLSLSELKGKTVLLFFWTST